MKRTLNFTQIFKVLLMAGLLAATSVAFTAMAQNREDDHWSPLDINTDASGNQFAYWSDPQNWSLITVPTVIDTNQVSPTYFNAAFDSANVYCVITNDVQVGQLMCGFGGGGTLLVTNGAHFQAGFCYGGQWTGIGFVNGPGTLIVGPGSDVTIDSHLWVGQGTADQGSVIIDGGTIHVPNGEVGISWNGIGGTNYITLTNGGVLYMRDWSSQTLGQPGSGAGNIGIMDLEAGAEVVVTNNALSYFPPLIASNQLIAFGGTGQIFPAYNAALNITTIVGLAPAGPDTPHFTVSPSNNVVSVGATATLHASATPATGYQWLFNGTPLVNGNGISGATTANLTIANFTTAETGSYSVTATNTGAVSQNDRNYATSTSASLSAESINLYPVITINGVNGSTYVVQYTTSLSPPVTWNTLTTVTIGAGPLQVVDTGSPLSTSRFYQVVPQ